MNVPRNLLLLVFGALAIFVLFHFLSRGTGTAAYPPMTYSEFVAAVDSGEVREVTLKGPLIYSVMRNGRMNEVYAAHDRQLVPRLLRHQVGISVQPNDDEADDLWKTLVSWLPVLLLIGVWIFFMRQMQGGGGKAMSFGKSRARLLGEKSGHITFEDVAGIDEAKQELREVVEFLKDPQRFQRLGGRIPRGCLLVGPPGTGKTLLARAIAGEAGVPFFTISGSDFVEMFVGVGASRVRDMFEQAKKSAPCIIFVDEIDAVGRHRGAGLGGGNDEREQTLNQLLVEMDGFDAKEDVILIGATNRPDVLDPALLRPGRFDRQVVVPTPDIDGREQILKVHLRKVQPAGDVEPRVIARGTTGFTGAELANLVNEAALIAARGGKRAVAMDDFEAARDKAMIGMERRSVVMSEDDRRLTAYHEAGHALVSLRVGSGDPLYKVTIVPRGAAFGATLALPDHDRHSYTRVELQDRIVVSLGGCVAEELVFGRDHVTTGAGNDIGKATDLARRMVTEFGFSDKVGRLRCAEKHDRALLGRALAEHRRVSDATTRAIDEEVRRLVDEAETRARALLGDGRDALDRLARHLLQYETLTGEDVRRVVAGEELDPTADPAHGTGTAASPNPRDPSSRGERPTDLWRPRAGPRGSNA